MLAAREDLADKAGQIAKNKGFTVFGMINNLLELNISAESLGITLEEAVDNYSTIRAIKNASFTLVLESLLYDTSDIAFQKARERTLKTWFEAGVWVARQYSSKGSEDQFNALIRDLKAFSWNAPDFTIEKRDEKISLRVLSPRFSESYTLLFNRFLEGILEAFDYDIAFSDVGRGNIRIEAIKKGG